MRRFLSQSGPSLSLPDYGPAGPGRLRQARFGDILLRYCLLGFWLLTLAGCSRSSLQEQQAYVFGTRVEVLVASEQPEQARQAIATVLREFDRLHRTYHAWQESELTTLNAALAAGRAQAVTPEMASLVRVAQTLAAEGEHLFDPGIGRLVRLWGFQADEFAARLPDPADLAAWQNEQPSIADLVVEGNTVRSAKRGVALDFGGYLKGVALDRAATLLRAQGMHNALINIGGNVLALGSKNGTPWRVGLQHPRQPGPLASIRLQDGEAIGTSGDYQRFFEVDGVRYAHLLDPRTARPANQTQALSVLIPAGERAGSLSDAVSKPLFIAGDDWPRLARQMKITHVLRVDRSGQLQVSAALHPRLEFVGQTPPLKVMP